MISIEEAFAKVVSNRIDLKKEKVKLEDAIGRTLAQDLLADRDFPAYDRVAMDGIAISYSAYLNGRRDFVSEGVCPAGKAKMRLESEDRCIEIMTGAILAEGCDTVVPYEYCEEISEGFRILKPIEKGRNIHRKASDYPMNSNLLASPKTIGAAEIALLATLGISEPTVFSLPQVAIVSTGTELVEVDQMPEEHQIRSSNKWMIKSVLRQNNVSCQDFHLSDNREQLKQGLEEILSDFEVIIISGAVSKGKYDFVPEVLEELGVVKLFHKVAQRPGKPFWFGRYSGKPVFAFPGNPVSTLICFYFYFMPWLHKCLGLELEVEYVTLEDDFEFKPRLGYFAQVKILNKKDGLRTARIVKGHGSGDLVNPTKVDGFVLLESDQTSFEKGNVVPFYSFA